MNTPTANSLKAELRQCCRAVRWQAKLLDASAKGQKKSNENENAKRLIGLAHELRRTAKAIETFSKKNEHI